MFNYAIYNCKDMARNTLILMSLKAIFIISIMVTKMAIFDYLKVTHNTCS